MAVPRLPCRAVPATAEACQDRHVNDSEPPGTPPVVAVDASIGAVTRGAYLCDRHLWAAATGLSDERFADHLALLGVRALVLDPAVVDGDGPGGRIPALSARLAGHGIATYAAAESLEAPDPAPQDPAPQDAAPRRPVDIVGDLTRGELPPVLGLDVALGAQFVGTRVVRDGDGQVRDVARTLATAALLLPGAWLMRGGDELGLTGPRSGLTGDAAELLVADLDSARSITAHLRRIAAHRPAGAAEVTPVDTGIDDDEAIAYRVDRREGRPYLVVANLGRSVAVVELGPAGSGKEGRTVAKRIASGAVAATLVTHEDTAVGDGGLRLAPWESRVYPL